MMEGVAAGNDAATEGMAAELSRSSKLLMSSILTRLRNFLIFFFLAFAGL